MNNLYSEIVKSQSNPNELHKLLTTCIGERMKMDKFFTMYLDKFEKKMNPDMTDTPVWNLYKTKLKEYEDIQRAIKLSDYYLKKAQLNV